MTKIVFGLVGPIASGKDTVKKYLKEKYNAQDCRFSTILRDVLNRIEITIERDTMQKLSIGLRKIFGEDVLAKVIAGDVKRMESDLIVIDGVRREEDIRYLKDFEGFVLVSVEADSKIRYERLLKRRENADEENKTYAQFLKDHEVETEIHIPELMERSKIKLDNNGSFEDLYKQIENMISELTLR